MTLYPVRVAAEQLGVAYSTLKRWVHTGHVRTSRTEGGHHRISDNEIERLLARQQSLTAVITADAARALKLRRGDDALAIVKSTEVMIARAGGAAPGRKRPTR